MSHHWRAHLKAYDRVVRIVEFGTRMGPYEFHQSITGILPCYAKFQQHTDPHKRCAFSLSLQSKITRISRNDPSS